MLQLQAVKSRDWCEAGAINLKKENEGSWSNGSDNSSDIKLDLSRTQALNTSVTSQNGKSLSLLPQLLNYTSRPDLQEEGFSNMFHNIDEQQNIWPWPEQHHFH